MSAISPPVAVGRNPGRTGEAVMKVLGYAFLTVMAIASMLPFIWMVSTSLKSEAEVFVFPPKWIPSSLHFENFATAWNAGGLNFATMFLNTMEIAVPVTLGQVLVSALSAYAFARIPFPGRDALFMAYLATMMVPGMVTLIPQFIMFRQMGWINTYYPLIVPGLFGSAFATFLLRQFFMTIPGELEDAAVIDGCSRFRVWWQIIMPLSKPSIATLTVFTFQGVYNDFMGPLIYLSDQTKYTVQLGLAAFQGVYSTHYEYLMAGTLISLIPIVALFLMAQKYFVEGVAMTGLKG